LGVTGAPKRDEDNTVSSTDFYAQIEWRPIDRLLVMGGVRNSKVRFESEDFFIAAGNPNDSGSIRYSRTSPVGGVTYELTRELKVYANVGKGFETPTFAELAYKPDGTPGLNFALQPAVSFNREIGAKWAPHPLHRATAALFRTDVEDEIVVASNAGGRTTFKNASRTRREGLELGWQGRLGYGFETAVAYTLLNARFTSSFSSVTGAPAVVVFVPSGNRLPGVPRATLYGELVWRHAASGFHAGLEARHNSKVFVDDQNSDAAESYTIGSVRAGFEQRTRRWRFTEYVRVDNVTDHDYTGSVIVAEGNRRFFEPSPGRNWMVGVSAQLSY